MDQFEKINLREERNIGEKINITFAFISQNFKSLASVIFYLCAPPLIICAIGYSTFFATFLRSVSAKRYLNQASPFDLFFNSGMAFAIITIFLLAIVAYSLIPLVCYSYLKVYRDSETPIEITAGMVWNLVRPRLLPVIGLNLILLIFIGIGFLFFIVPGIYLSVVFALFNVVYVMEELSFSESLTRCFALINGKWWSTFGLMFICAMIVYLISFIFQVPGMVLNLVGIFLKWDSTEILSIAMVTSTFSILAQMMFTSITLFALGFQYFSLAERLDGTGMRQLIASIGSGVKEVADDGEY